MLVRRADVGPPPGPGIWPYTIACLAAHSPILASVPGADIVEVNDQRFDRMAWEDLQLVDHWRRYLNNPAAYLRHMIDGVA